MAAIVGAIVLAIASAWTVSPATASDVELWQALREGRAIAVMRHALAPGTGDPADFTLEDCSTQRNLSETGRRQARAIGERLRANGIEIATVLTSQWCRCRETAELLALGEVQDLPALNSFFSARQREPEQTRAVKAWITQYDAVIPVVFVTHQVNVSALTGRFTSSGEMIVIDRRIEDGVKVLGSIEN
ncbi:MAG: histidine phosphatase family protein [Pseudomonadota bacterium]